MRRFGLPCQMRVGFVAVATIAAILAGVREASYLFVCRPTERELLHFTVRGELGLLSSALEEASPRPKATVTTE